MVTKYFYWTNPIILFICYGPVKLIQIVSYFAFYLSTRREWFLYRFCVMNIIADGLRGWCRYYK